MDELLRMSPWIADIATAVTSSAPAAAHPSNALFLEWGRWEYWEGWRLLQGEGEEGEAEAAAAVARE